MRWKREVSYPDPTTYSDTILTALRDATKFISSLNPAQFGNLNNDAPACGNTITVTYEGKSVVVTIIDSGGEGTGGLDLSPATFEQLAVSPQPRQW
jgi:hypothetical protein